MVKKILKISAIVLGVALLGLIYYYFFFANTKINTSSTTATTSGSNFFPFGQGGGTATNTDGGQNNTDTQTQQGTYLEKLRLISNEPVAGATFIEKTAGVYIRYIEKATGHIFDVATFGAENNKISNTTIPKLYEAFFTEKGASFIGRYTDDDETITTFYAKVATTTSPTPVATNISFLAVSPSETNIFYLQKSTSGTVGITSTPNGGTKKQIWDSPLRSLLPQYAGENQVLLTTKPNAQIRGYAYMVNTKTASVKTILQNLTDLSTLVNPQGNILIYYTNSGNGGLFSYSLTNGTTTQLTPVALPEKCVFDANAKNIMYCGVSSQNLYYSSLDDWYLGLISFSDDIWRYDLSSNTSTLIENLKINAGRDIDAINLHLNSSGSLLLFTSKIDGSLWSLNISQ